MVRLPQELIDTAMKQRYKDGQEAYKANLMKHLKMQIDSLRGDSVPESDEWAKAYHYLAQMIDGGTFDVEQ